MSGQNYPHIPVLQAEVLEAIIPVPGTGGRYLDGTLGMAGHACAILERAGSKAMLCGLDRDPQALMYAQQRLAPFGEQAHCFHQRYSAFNEALDTLGWDMLDGALIDIGVSSLQLDTPERGFSFYADGPLDMRMNQDAPEASDAPVSRLIQRLRHEELRDVLSKYGEEPQAGRIAAAIIRERQKKPIQTTRELAAIVEQAYPAAWRAKARNHPATRTFQALRMLANDELGELQRFMDTILARLKPGGRLAVITFHSLEDRVVKHSMKAWAQGCICPRHLPLCVCQHEPEAVILTPKPVKATTEEIAKNPRSSCAKLRVAEKTVVSVRSETTHDTATPLFQNTRPRGRRQRETMRQQKRLLLEEAAIHLEAEAYEDELCFSANKKSCATDNDD